MTSFIWLGAGAFMIGMILTIYLYGRSAGADALKAKQQEKTFEETSEASRTRDRVRNDAEYRERLHDRFDG